MAVTFVRLPHPVTLEGQSAGEVPAGRTVAELTAGMGEVAVAVNGRRLPASAFGEAPPDGAVVVARSVVAGGDTNPLRTILQIGLLVASIWVPGTAWFTALGRGAQIATSAAILVGGSLVINAIAPPRLPGLERGGQSPDPVYSLTGGANRARPYEPLLLVLGTHRVFPDLGAREYTVFQSRPRDAAAVDYTGAAPPPGSAGFFTLPTLGVFRPGAPGGVDQYLYQILNYGLGRLRISDHRIGDSLLADLEEVTTELSGADGAVALVAGNVDTSPGAVLEDTDWVRRSSAARTTKVDLDFTGLIFQIDEDDGDIVSHSVDVLIELWPDGDEAAKRASTVTLNGSSSDQYRLTVPFDGLDEGVWVVRVRRAAAKSTEDTVHDDVAWAALRSYQRDDGDYAGQTRLGVRVRATGQLSGRLDRLSSTVSQLIPAWDGSQWTADQASSNPAWLFRWYALGVRAGTALQAGVGLPESELDDAAIKRWGAWCDQEGLACNLVLDRDLTHADVLQLIAKCGRASPSWATGRLGAVYDQGGQPASAFFGPGNIIAGSFEIDWVAGNAADEIICRYIEPDADWQWNTVRRNVPGVAGRSRSATLTLWGVTDRDLAAEECNLQAARQIYHRRRMRWRVGPEGLDVARGAVVNVSHALIDGGATGRLLGGTAANPQLSQPVTLGARDGETDHMLFRLPGGGLHLSAVSAPADADDPAAPLSAVSLATPLPEAPGAHGVSPLDVLYRHYTSGLPPVKAKVVAVEPRSSAEFAIEAIDEVDAYYDAATSDLTVDLPLLARRVPAVARIDVAETLVAAADGFAVVLTASLTVQGDWRGGTVTASLDGAPARVVGRLDAQDLEASWITGRTGTVTIRAVPGSAAAPAGRALEVTHAIAGPPAPNGVAGGAAISTVFGVDLLGGAAAPTATGRIRVADGGAAVDPLVRRTAQGAATLQVGLSAGTAAATLSLREFLPQVQVGDVVSVYENRTTNWVDFVVASVPASIPDGAGAAAFGVAFLENGTEANVTGACSLGFSRARRGADGRSVDERGVHLYVADKTGTSLTFGASRPHEAPDGYRLTLLGGAGFATTVGQVNLTGGATGFSHQFTELAAGTQYRAEAYAIYGDGNGPTDHQLAYTSSGAGGQRVTGTSETTLQAVVPVPDGEDPSYEWEHDAGIAPGDLVWMPGGTTATNEATIRNLSPNASYTVRCRITTGPSGARVTGGWFTVGAAQTLQQADAPGVGQNLLLSFTAEGRAQMSWDGPAATTHPLFRWGVRLWRDGVLVERLGLNEPDNRTRTTMNPMHAAGSYYFDVTALSRDGGGVEYRGDRVFSAAVHHAGVSEPPVDDNPFTTV